MLRPTGVEGPRVTTSVSVALAAPAAGELTVAFMLKSRLAPWMV